MTAPDANARRISPHERMISQVNAKANRSEKYDLTRGSILNKLLLVALPIMGTQIIQMAYNMTDMFWLGKIGSHAVAASGTVGMYMWLSVAFQMLARIGAEIGVSQSLGKERADEAGVFAAAGFWLSVACGLLYALVLGIFRVPLVGFFAIQEADVVADAINYMLIICAGLPFTFITAAVTGIFNGSGNSRVPFIINLIGLGANMALDPLFILGLGQGVAGAAVATAAAQILAGVLSIAVMLNARFKPLRTLRLNALPSLKHALQILRWSTPVCIESFFFTFLSMIVSRMIAEWGAGAIAAQKVGSQIESLSWLIAGGFSSAIGAFVGQNFGAGHWRRVHEGVRISSMAMALWGVVVTALLYFGGSAILGVFLPGETESIAAGTSLLRILALCQIAGCLEGVASGAFRGLGHTAPPSIISISTNMLRVLLAYLLSRGPLGLDGIWWGMSLGALLRGGGMYIWYLIYARRQPKDDAVEAR